MPIFVPRLSQKPENKKICQQHNLTHQLFLCQKITSVVFKYIMQDSPMENHSSKWCCFSLPLDVFDQELPTVDSVHLLVQDAEDPVQRLNGTPLCAC
jgi:hypothetical protein